MAEPVNFLGANLRFTAPKGRDDIGDLAVFRQPDGPVNASCWRLTAEELDEVNRTGCVWLSVLSGQVFFPALVGSESCVRESAAQYGAVWVPEGWCGAAPDTGE